MKTTYYRARHSVCEDGLTIYFKTFIQVHETACFSYCVSGDLKHTINRSGATGLILVKKLNSEGVKVHKIHKTCSRFAFTCKELALNHFKMLKRKQIVHMKRDVGIYELLLESLGDVEVKDQKIIHHDSNEFLVGGTGVEIGKYFLFD